MHMPKGLAQSGNVTDEEDSILPAEAEGLNTELDEKVHMPLYQDMEVLGTYPLESKDNLLQGNNSQNREEAGEYQLCQVRAANTTLGEGPAVPSSVPDHLGNLYSGSIVNLAEAQQTQLASLLAQYGDVFSQNDQDLGRTALEIHRIPTGEASPVRLPPRRAPMHLRADIQTQIEAMLQQGIVEDCANPWKRRRRRQRATVPREILHETPPPHPPDALP